MASALSRPEATERHALYEDAQQTMQSVLAICRATASLHAELSGLLTDLGQLALAVGLEGAVGRGACCVWGHAADQALHLGGHVDDARCSRARSLHSSAHCCSRYSALSSGSMALSGAAGLQLLLVALRSAERAAACLGSTSMQGRQQQLRQQEVAAVVGADVGLKAVLSPLPAACTCTAA